MSEESMELAEFQRLLPFYVNGTLAPAQAAACAAFIEQHPAARQEWQFMRTMREQLQAYAGQADPLHGYEALAQRLAAGRPAPLPWWRRWWRAAAGTGGAGGQGGGPRWGASPAMALLLLLVTVQLGVTLAPLVDTPAGAYRGTAAPARTAHIKLVVRAQTRFEDLALLLEANHCHIVWGPSAAGELWLALDQPAQAAEVRARLAASALVDDAVLLERGR